MSLDTPVTYVRGVGPRVSEALAARSIQTAEDLLYHLPFRYEDRLNPRELSALKAGETVSLIAEVRGSAMLHTKRAQIFELTVGQGLQTLKCVWFHGTWLKDKFRAGQMVALYGRVEPSRSTRNFKMIQPQYEILPGELDDDETRLLEVGRITPVYESLGGSKLGSRWLRKVQHQLLESLNALPAPIPETLPTSILERLGMPGRLESLSQVHFPPVGTSFSHLAAWSTPAQKRLIFEELFYLELGLELKRRRLRQRAGIAFQATPQVREAIRQILPFRPTAAQKQAFSEIVTDMRSESPMRRLLQGDVGSGKTIVAIEATLVAMENGYQAAIMAPTEILATQHYLAARKLLARSTRPYRVLLLTGSLDPAEKRAARRAIAAGTVNLVIGTHALIEEKVEFDKLGLVVVDEQHRFGVMQRFRLMKKPNTAEPDVLIMTATPIPRTLALSIYGDLDVSILNELPPGRTPIVTRRIADTRSQEVWDFVRKQVKIGHQAYVVYPVVEGPKDDQSELDFPADTAPEKPAKTAKKSSSKSVAGLFKTEEGDKKPSPLKSATAMYEELRTGMLHGLRLGLLHGRLSADDKDVIMRRFQRGEIDVLIATTVIEVGVDVPNASVIVIEHAERFGLAQLHQLRGRVGRGKAKSYCVLMTGARVTPEAEQRLDAMLATQDGFELAEIDLKQRGPGEFFGTRQAGLPDFRVANLVRDREILELAKKEASDFIHKPDPGMSEEQRAAVWAHLRGAWQRRYGLVEAG